MTDQPELLLCPFCNGKPQLPLDDDVYYCEDCGAMPYVVKHQDPVDVWNTRPQTIPKWLKDEILLKFEFVSHDVQEGFNEGYMYALKWVLSLEESP